MIIVKRIVFVVVSSTTLAVLAFYGAGPLLRWFRAATPSERGVALLIVVALLTMACGFGYAVHSSEREIKRRTGRVYSDPERSVTREKW